MKKNTKSIKKKQEKKALVKIAGLAGGIAGKLSNQKDHLIEMAGSAINLIKTAVHDITEKTQPVVKKTIKKSASKAANKLVKPPVKKVKKKAPTKKASPMKKIAKKSAKSMVTKVVKKTAKKK